jgi:hypothetical protein
MKIHLVFHVSLLEPFYTSIILRKIPKQLPSIELNGEQKHKMERKIEFKNIKPLVTIPNLLACI